MDIEKKWGLSLASIMFLTSSLVHCQNQTIPITRNGTTTTTNSSTLEDIVPGSLKIGTGSLFEAPDLFGGEPFSLKTDPVTGEVDFQTRTVNVQTVNDARDREEAQKVSELQEDLKTRVPSSAHLPLEARDEEYNDAWGEPIKRGDVEYYDEEEQPEAREPIMVPQKSYPQKPTTEKEEESFMSIFESLFGGAEEEKKPEPLRNNPPFKQNQPTTERIRSTLPPRYNELPERRPSTPPRYQQPTERYNNYKQPERQPYNPYQQINRPNGYQQQRLPERPPSRPNFPREPERNTFISPERPNSYESRPVQENTVSNRPSFPREPDRNTFISPERPNSYESKPVSENSEVYEVTPQKPYQKPLELPSSTTTQRTTTTEKVTTTIKPEIKETRPTTQESTTTIDWQTIENNKIDTNRKENIDRQDIFQNEVSPPNAQNSPDYFNFINLPVHYSTKDTAIPLISTSYANTKVQGMGASKYEKNNGKYSNHKYDPSNTTTKRPSYWQSKRPAPERPSFSNPVDFSSLEYDDAAIGIGADFGGYGHKEGVKVKTETTQPPTRQTTPFTRTTTQTTKTTIPQTRPTTQTTRLTTPQTRPTILSTRITTMPTRPPTTTTTTIRTTPFRPPATRPAPVKEYDEYDYESYPAQVKPVPHSPSSTTTTTTTTRRPADTIPEESKITPNKPGIKEPEYEYYDYDTEAPVAPSTTSTTTTTTTKRPTTTTTSTTTTTTTQKYKLRYPSLSKDRIRRPDEKVEVVVPTKIETTTQITTTSPKTTTNQVYNRRPTTTKDPAPVFEEDVEENFVPPRRDEIKPIIVSPGKPESENVNIVLVPAKSSTEVPRPETSATQRYPGSNYQTSSRQPPQDNTTPSRRPPSDYPAPSRQPANDYTTEFTIGVVQGHPSNQRPGFPPGQGHYVASSIAASPFDGPDEPFRPIARPAGMSASFQVVGDTSELETAPEQPPDRLHHTPSESDVHEPHEFIPSPQFHRPASDHFVVGTSFNARPPTKPAVPFKPPNDQQTAPSPERNEIVKPQKPYYNQPPTDFFSQEKPPQAPNQKPYIPHREEFYKPPPKPSKTEEDDYGWIKTNNGKDKLLQSQNQKPYVPNREEYYKPPNKPLIHQPKPDEDQDYGWLKPNKEQTNVEIGTDYDFDGIQTEPKPGQYVIFPKPHLNSEINENRVKTPNPGIPHYHEKTTTEVPPPTTERHKDDVEETQQGTASNYPRPHWEKNGKPTFLVNNPNRIPPQISPNLVQTGNIPPKFRKPVSPSNLPPIRKNYNEGNFPSKQNLPNILPQFRPNAKVSGPPRPYRPMMPPNRRKENFPYRIQNEPDVLMHRDFEVEEEIIPKFITNRVRLPEYDQMMIQKRVGVAAVPPSPRRVQRTPVTTLQMLQQTHGMKKQQVPPTREDIDPTSPMHPPAYKPFKDEQKEVYVVYPVKTPFNSNIKIEDPDKIDYSYNQTFDQVPLLKPSKKKEKVKVDFPYGFVTPDEKMKGDRKDVPNTADSHLNNGKAPEVRPNIQDYMPMGVKAPNQKQESIDMSLHMQSNNQWNQVYNEEVITRNEEPQKVPAPPTQYHTLMKNSNASEFTIGAVMHTLPEQSRKGQVTSVNVNGDIQRVNRPELNVNERIANGKIVTVSMPLDVKEEKEPQNSFQAPFQASSSAHGSTGWNILENPDETSNKTENVTENSNSTFNIENFTPELIGGFKPIYSSSEEEGSK